MAREREKRESRERGGERERERERKERRRREGDGERRESEREREREACIPKTNCVFMGGGEGGRGGGEQREALAITCYLHIFQAENFTFDTVQFRFVQFF